MENAQTAENALLITRRKRRAEPSKSVGKKSKKRVEQSGIRGDKLKPAAWIEAAEQDLDLERIKV